jgi:hypothetical protein
VASEIQTHHYRRTRIHLHQFRQLAHPLGFSRDRATSTGAAIITASNCSTPRAVPTSHPSSPYETNSYLRSQPNPILGNRGDHAIHQRPQPTAQRRKYREPSFDAARACNAAIRLPCSRSIATNGAITARTLSFATSPPKTPLSSGAPIFSQHLVAEVPPHKVWRHSHPRRSARSQLVRSRHLVAIGLLRLRAEQLRPIERLRLPGPSSAFHPASRPACRSARYVFPRSASFEAISFIAQAKLFAPARAPTAFRSPSHPARTPGRTHPHAPSRRFRPADAEASNKHHMHRCARVAPVASSYAAVTPAIPPPTIATRFASCKKKQGASATGPHPIPGQTSSTVAAGDDLRQRLNQHRRIVQTLRPPQLQPNSAPSRETQCRCRTESRRDRRESRPAASRRQRVLPP